MSATVYLNAGLLTIIMFNLILDAVLDVLRTVLAIISNSWFAGDPYPELAQLVPLVGSCSLHLSIKLLLLIVRDLRKRYIGYIQHSLELYQEVC